MGQYYNIVNINKRQYLNPHKFGDGLKLQEFGNASCGTMFALAALLSSGNGKGGGDLHTTSNLIGSWAGDNIYVLGDYSEEVVEVPGLENLQNHPLHKLVSMKKNGFKDISDRVIKAIAASSPQHPLALVAMNLEKDTWRHRPQVWGTSSIFTKPNEKNILSLTHLMTVIEADFGETEEITAVNLAWRLQNMYGYFAKSDPSIHNTHQCQMTCSKFTKVIENFNPLYWSQEVRNLRDSINPFGEVKNRVTGINLVLKNEVTQNQYSVELTFPCSLMDLKQIIKQVLSDCQPQKETLRIGGNNEDN